jgi:DNA replication protein DnaC
MDEPEESEASLFNGIFGTNKSDAYNVRVLVLDDVGREHASLSGWQKSVLHHLLRTRYNNGLPTIVTSNVLKKEWAALYGDATASFVDEAFVPLSMDNEDLRRL